MKKYNKLVRDNIPHVLDAKEVRYRTHTADDEEYGWKLNEKLREEVEEFITDGSPEELADVLEVLDALIAYKRFNRKALEILQRDKKEKRGGFEKRIILDEAES